MKPDFHYRLTNFSKTTLALYTLFYAVPVASAEEKLLIRTSQKVFCSTQQQEEIVVASRFGEAASMVDDAVESGGVAGAVHLVVRDGEIIHSHASGVRDIETNEPLEADTLVRIYSMTKPITSVAAMTLFEQGKFQLDDPVAKFIPAFEQATVWDNQKQVVVASRRPLTVRDVFRHTTGYAYGGYASTDFRLDPELNLFQIFIRQHIPSDHELANRAFRSVYGELQITAR